MSFHNVRHIGIRIPLALVALTMALAVMAPSSALADGSFAVDCNATTAGVQATCTGAQNKPSGSSFDIQIHVTAAPAVGYAGFDTKTSWTDANLQYSSSAGETLWPNCNFPASLDFQPGEPAIGYGCASFPAISSTFTGAVLKLHFTCQADGTTPMTLDPANTKFTDIGSNPVIPGSLANATVQCGVPPPNPPTFSATDPVSPSSNNNPKIKGTADAGTTVKLYTNSSCSGSPIATGTAATFASPGIVASVGDNTDTTFYGTATSSVASACSSGPSGSIAYTEDSSPPDTTIDSGPTGTIQTTSATFGFSSDDGSATFECRLDGGSFAPCTSTKTYNALSDGLHTFEVRAKDAAGNADASPASQSFTVLTAPATIVVTTTSDELNSDGDCSLREAISAANTDAPVDACPAGSGHDTITVPAGTYNLGIAGTGENNNATGDLDILADLTLDGDGAPTTIVDGGDLDRVFHVDPAHDNITVDINGFTVRNGSAGNGGGINNAGTTLILNDTTISGNTATGSPGGGLYNGPTGVLTLNNSTVSGNTGGAAGGIGSSGTLTLNNSTVSGNTSTAFPGGGVYVTGGTADLNNSTIANNSAYLGGGGIYNAFGIATLKNTIIANNSPNDCWALVTSAGHNLIEDTTTCSIGGDPPDLASNITGVDPNLGPLQDNGGSTETHDLLKLPSPSPAIDAGSGDCPPPAFDQRGIPRPQGSTCDIGAVEACDDATDADGDGLSDCKEILEIGTDYLNPDTDRDGCKDGAEINNPPALGGDRNPLKFWDFFDTQVPTDGTYTTYTKDKKILVSDINAVLQRYFASGDPGDPGIPNPGAGPLSTPPPPPAYHTAYDRTGPLDANPRHINPPDGKILVGDILMTVKQYFDDCTA